MLYISRTPFRKNTSRELFLGYLRNTKFSILAPFSLTYRIHASNIISIHFSENWQLKLYQPHWWTEWQNYHKVQGVTRYARPCLYLWYFVICPELHKSFQALNQQNLILPYSFIKVELLTLKQPFWRKWNQFDNENLDKPYGYVLQFANWDTAIMQINALSPTILPKEWPLLSHDLCHDWDQHNLSNFLFKTLSEHEKPWAISRR